MAKITGDIGKENTNQPGFYKKVFQVVAGIPRGKITTYGAVAKACACPKGARAVGNALKNNRDTQKVPCHRVVKNNFELGGYAGGQEKKKKLLIDEGITIKGKYVQNPSEVFFDPE